MSLQRREGRWQHMKCAVPDEAEGPVSPTPGTRFDNACANNEMTRPNASAWLVANSLQKDHRAVRLVSNDAACSSRGTRLARPPRCRPVRQSPPAGSSLPPISFLTGSARLHLTLPQAPAGERRWAERQDGKGNLYFKHAA
jgi:hypothetical protein